MLQPAPQPLKGWDGDGEWDGEGWVGKGFGVSGQWSGRSSRPDVAWMGVQETVLGKKGSGQGCRGIRDDEGRGTEKIQTAFLPCWSWLGLSLRVCRLQEGTARGGWAVTRSNQAEGVEPLPWFGPIQVTSHGPSYCVL
jgi:hypothetical protein